MNGLNDTKKWQKLILLLLIVYMIILSIIIAFFINFSSVTSYFEQQRVADVLSKIDQSITLDKANMQLSFDELVQNENLELVVLTKEEIYYATVPIIDFAELSETINIETISYRKVYEIHQGNQDFEVYLVMYKSFEKYMYTLFTPMLIFVVLECLLLSLMFFLMFQKVISPLRKLKEKIDDLQLYKFDTTIDKGTQSLLLNALQSFSEDLSSKINLFEHQYTGLEIQLQKNQENAVYKMQLMQSLVHDLKTPLSVAVLLNEQLQKMSTDELLLEKLEIVRNVDEQLAENINEILTLVADVDVAISEKEEFDIIKIIQEILRLLQPIFLKKQIKMEIDCIPKLEIFANKIELKQIIHNVIMNASQYINENGKFILEAYDEDDRFFLNVYNDVEDNKQIQFDQVFNLFYTEKQLKNSSGVGMFVIKNMVEKLGGTVEFLPVDTGVELKIELLLERLERGLQDEQNN